MRSRNIKPGFFKNEILGQADPLLGILFAGLWCIADKEGRLEDRPLRIKAEVFPYRDGLDINRYLTDLSRLGFILRYQVDGKSLIQVLKFKDHQNPHHTEKASELVEYTVGCLVTVDSRLDNGGNPPDSLIPNSLIPDLLIPKRPPLPPQGEQSPLALDVVLPAKKKRKTREEKIQGFSADTRKVVNTLLDIWPIRGTNGEDTSPIDVPTFAQRISEILDRGQDAETLIEAGTNYAKTPRPKFSAPQFFFGHTAYGGKGDAPWVGYVKLILTKREKVANV